MVKETGTTDLDSLILQRKGKLKLLDYNKCTDVTIILFIYITILAQEIKIRDWNVGHLVTIRRMEEPSHASIPRRPGVFL